MTNHDGRNGRVVVVDEEVDDEPIVILRPSPQSQTGLIYPDQRILVAGIPSPAENAAYNKHLAEIWAKQGSQRTY